MEKGTIFKFHNDLDTDQIIASQYLLLPNLEEMKSHAFESLDPDFAQKVKPGDILGAIAGESGIQRAGSGCVKSVRCKSCYRKIICKNFL